jgi:hypothetical protein
MNSYRCPQCGLLNWVTADQCKRCRLPNQANAVPQQFVSQPVMQNTMVAATAQTAVQMQFAPTPNYQNPQNNHQTAPPPPFQQQSAGAYGANNTSQYVNNYYPQNNHQTNSDEIIKAEKHIKNGWIGGVVWASLLGFVTVVFMFLSAALPDLPKSAPNSADALKAAEMFSKAMIGAFAVMTVVIGGLSYGIKQKSMACAIIMVVFSALSMVSSLADKSIGGALFATGMLALFAQATGGIITLKKNGQI